MVLTARTYQQVALEDDRLWELHAGQLVEKSPMSVTHGRSLDRLYLSLATRLDRAVYEMRSNHARAAKSAETYYIPDLAVIPIEMVDELDESNPYQLEVYTEPLPLVVEVWSPSTGSYDVMSKLPDYQERGDAEIWLLHPYDRTVTTSVRQLDGTYADRTYGPDETIRLAALPGIVIPLREIFG